MHMSDTRHAAFKIHLHTSTVFYPMSLVFHNFYYPSNILPICFRIMVQQARSLPLNNYS